MNGMHRMFSTIIKNLQHSPLAKESMQTFAANSGMVQIYLMYICDPEQMALNQEEDTIRAFEQVTLICDGNDSTCAQMRQADIVRCIDSASQITPKTAHWHSVRDLLVAILG